MHPGHTWQGIDLHWAYGGLLRSIARRTQCGHRAKDALHDAFVRYAVKPRHDTLDEPQAYFRRVVQSVLVDHHREAQHLPLAADQNTGDTSDAHDFALGHFHPSAQDLYAIRQRLDLLQRLLDALPPKCREVFWLFRVEGHSQPDIAARLGVSVNMVERHVMRALIDLRAAREMLGA